MAPGEARTFLPPHCPGPARVPRLTPTLFFFFFFTLIEEVHREENGRTSLTAPPVPRKPKDPPFEILGVKVSKEHTPKEEEEEEEPNDPRDSSSPPNQNILSNFSRSKEKKFSLLSSSFQMYWGCNIARGFFAGFADNPCSSSHATEPS